jgi:hypothetical protein
MHWINCAERGNPVPSPLGKLTARHAEGGLEKDAERSERPTVIAGISRQVRGSARRLPFSGSLVT